MRYKKEYFNKSEKKHIIIYDLEYTSSKEMYQRKWSDPEDLREIVQIGALKIDVETLEEVDTFICLVKPTVLTKLDPYFIELTNIQQDEIDREGLDFEDAITQFRDFCWGYAAASYGNDMVIIGENLMQKNCHELFSNNISFFDISLHLHRADPELDPLSSGDLASHYGVPVPGYDRVENHDALYDCRSILTALRVLKERGKWPPAPLFK